MPKIRNMNENSDSSVAPTAMKIARMINARMMPNVNTLC